MVHWAAIRDFRAACGEWVRDEFGAPTRESDPDIDQVSCKRCLRCHPGKGATVIVIDPLSEILK
jgi:hypothetical protein